MAVSQNDDCYFQHMIKTPPRQSGHGGQQWLSLPVKRNDTYVVVSNKTRETAENNLSSGGTLSANVYPQQVSQRGMARDKDVTPLSTTVPHPTGPR